MKALLVLVVVLGGVWFWRNRKPVQRQQPPKRVLAPQDMRCCHLCGTHIPASEAVTGHLGNYCCQEHLQQLEP